MSGALPIVLDAGDWISLFTHYLLLSLMSIGGAISTTADMHRYLVEQHHWLTPAQFNAAIAIAQAAPGPNVLFVALMGWQVGLNAGSTLAALGGVAVTMTGIMLPSTTLTYLAAQWGHRNRHLLGVRTFKQGMAPIVIGLLLSTGWILAANNGTGMANWPLWLLSAASGVIIWRTRLHLLWLLAGGALLGWFGWV
ncbi:chromate transporter [Actimicrobium sp. CCI2.3]|uniref:chromate transporter n=1 Tax=Actimicrobium sp. CCI2.3 TaxID=3048616 RepID=UPI002AB34414|nr:chromate transporter [Actimicrobium sp. CCI2.3]MDY7574197.1 chromate transporter [Actimicrobium sp. CCI2.3]MEB0023854.1 chromate transporter [Actimicrobium sp. CCI2.3]